jgi:hypothetical protein
MKRPLTRHLLLSLLVLIAANAYAQKPPEFTYTFQFNTTLTHLQVKVLGEELLSQDPAIKHWADVGSTTASARGQVVLDLDQLGAVMASSGAAMVSHDMVDMHAPVQEEGLPAGFPVMPNTGDPAADQANYAAAKAAWIKAHPQEYQELIAPK